MICPNCEGELKCIEDKVIVKYMKCGNCAHETLEYPEDDCCFYKNDEPVLFYRNQNDREEHPENYLVYNQCQSCGRKNGSALKKSLSDKQKLKYFDYELQANRKVLNNEMYERLSKIRKKITEIKNDTFWDDYVIYLKSEEWKTKRRLVLKRDNYICQSCLTERANEVHHTIGYFRKNEPLFTLVSLCNKCHRIITDIERGNHKDAEKITHRKFYKG